MGYHHVTAMPRETIEMLACRAGGVYVDGTLGGAGHARAVCERIAPGGTFVGLDRDPAAVTNGRRLLAGYDDLEIHLFNENFVNLASVLSGIGLSAVDGIVLDLGVSLYQFEASGRGFSFQRDEPLDMRMDPAAPVTAADLVNGLDEGRLARLMKQYGEERRARAVARRIVAERRRRPIETSGRLADIVRRAVGPQAGRRIHPATRVFMALRIAVNGELEHLERFMARVADLLTSGGRLCVLSFHSLEDRIVKQSMRALADPCRCPADFPVCTCGRQPSVRVLTRKVMRPGEDEVRHNPMARSTRLRAMEKL